jgi:hypothetical protein
MTTERIITADKIVTVTTDVEDREVCYDDVLDAVKIEHDDWHGGTPWDDCDGWEHDAEDVMYDRDDDRRDARGFALCAGRRNAVHITVSDDIVERWGCDGYPGASKQVRAELVAQVKRKALDQLVKWYTDGWEYYYVGGGYKDCSDGCGGIDSHEYAEEVRSEVAAEIAAQLEREGYVVTDKPEPDNRSSADIRRDGHKRRLESYVVHAR